MKKCATSDIADDTGFLRVTVKSAETIAPIAKRVNKTTWRSTAVDPVLVVKKVRQIYERFLPDSPLKSLDRFDALDLAQSVKDLLQMRQVSNEHCKDSFKHRVEGIDVHPANVGILHRNHRTCDFVEHAGSVVSGDFDSSEEFACFG